MFNILVCIKQVPMVSGLPWDPKTGTPRRELAEGMMDPASRRALEVALQIKEHQSPPGEIVKVTALSMGPEMAEEVLFQAIALGGDEGVLLSDPAMAGADTYLTSHILARFIQQQMPDVDLILCGDQTSDSETGQVGPQLALELDMPSISWVSELRMDYQDTINRVRVERHVDDFIEVLEMELPGLLTIDQSAFSPVYTPLGGVVSAFDANRIQVVDAKTLGLDEDFSALHDSPTQVVDVFSPTVKKDNVMLKGAAKTVVGQLFKEFGKTIGFAGGKNTRHG